MNRRPQASSAGLALLLLLSAAGCTEPRVTEDDIVPDTEAAPAPAESPEDLSALRDRLAQLRRTVTATRDHLAAAQERDTLAAATRDAERALDLLLSDTQGSATTAEGLLPTRTRPRGDTSGPPDLFSATLTAAQGSSSALASDVTELLRDPVAGDLGAWQRDAEGMVDLARQAAGSAGDLDALERAVLELPGEATRALAWTFAARDADELMRARNAAERADAHLRIIEVALDDVIDGPDAAVASAAAPVTA